VRANLCVCVPLCLCQRSGEEGGGGRLVVGLDEEWVSRNYKSITCLEVTVDVDCEECLMY